MQMDEGGGGSGPPGIGIDVDVAFAPEAGTEHTWARGTGEAIPGDPEGIREFAGVLEAKAVELRDYLDEIQRLDPDWTGDAVAAFLALKDMVPPQMELVAERFDSVAAALHDYADELEDARADANGARDEAYGLLDDLADAKDDLEDAEGLLDGFDRVSEWEEEHNQAFQYDAPEDLAGEVARIEGLLEGYWDDFCTAFDNRWVAAEACTAAIEDTTGDTGTTGRLNDAPIENARDDAAELARLADDLGLDMAEFHPRDLENLDPDDPAYIEFHDLLGEVLGRLDHGRYGETFFDELEADGIWTLLGTIEMYQAHQQNPDVDVPDLDIEGTLLVPFLNGFAEATNHMDQDVLDELTEVDEWWQLVQLGLLVGGEGGRYEPGFLADACDVVLVTDEYDGRYSGWSEIAWERYWPPAPGNWGAGTQLWPTLSLNSPHLNAYNALADNPAAAWDFAGRGDDYLDAILRPDTTQIVRTAGERGVVVHDTVAEMGEQAAADVAHAVFVDAPAEDSRRLGSIPGVAEFDPGQELELSGSTGLYWDVIGLVAEGEGDIPAPVLRELAGILGEHDGAYMDVLFNYINDPWDDQVIHETRELPDEVFVARDFLRELMGDDQAGVRAWAEIDGWTAHELVDWFPRNEGVEDGERDPLFRIGRLHELTAIAEYAVHQDDIERQRQRQTEFAAVVDLPLGVGPWSAFTGTLNTVATPYGLNVGNIVFDADSGRDELESQALAVVHDAGYGRSSYLVYAAYEAGQWTQEDIVEAAGGVDFFDAEGHILPLEQMTPSQHQSYRDWLYSNQVYGNNDSGLLRRDLQDLNGGFDSAAVLQLTDV